MKKFITSVIAVVSAAMIFTGCSKDDKKSVGTKEDLIGTWKLTVEEDVFRGYSMGSCPVEDVTITYEFSTDDVVKMYEDGRYRKSYTYSFSQSAKTLTWTSPSGTISEDSVEELTSAKLVLVENYGDYTGSRTGETEFGKVKGTTIYVNYIPPSNGWYYDESGTAKKVYLDYVDGDRSDINSYIVLDAERSYYTKVK